MRAVCPVAMSGSREILIIKSHFKYIHKAAKGNNKNESWETSMKESEGVYENKLASSNFVTNSNCTMTCHKVWGGIVD